MILKIILLLILNNEKIGIHNSENENKKFI